MWFKLKRLKGKDWVKDLYRPKGCKCVWKWRSDQPGSSAYRTKKHADCPIHKGE